MAFLVRFNARFSRLNYWLVKVLFVDPKPSKLFSILEVLYS